MDSAVFVWTSLLPLSSPFAVAVHRCRLPLPMMIQKEKAAFGLIKGREVGIELTRVFWG